jgi:hypothetical protein
MTQPAHINFFSNIPLISSGALTGIPVFATGFLERNFLQGRTVSAACQAENAYIEMMGILNK